MSDININNRPNRPYKLLPYDPLWKVQFEQVAKEISPIFGNNLVRVEHIGSTAVPGMFAKPQIDLFVIVKDLDMVKDVYKEMEALGFKSMGDFIQKKEPEEYFIKDNEQGQRLFSIHVMQLGNPEVEETILFRDFLRANRDARDAYISHKFSLMERYSEQDYNSYSKGKVQFIEDLKAKAIEWDKIDNI